MSGVDDRCSFAASQSLVTATGGWPLIFSLASCRGVLRLVRLCICELLMTTLLVLANSFKLGGRCLAGVDESGRWVRPVVDAEGGAIAESRLQVGGQCVLPGHEIIIQLGAEVPLPFQSENIILGASPVEFAPAPTPRQVQTRLQRLARNVASFAGSPRTYIDHSEYEAGFSPASLSLARTDNIKLVWKTNWKGIARPRAIFMTDVGGWDLPYTGYQWEGFPPRVAGASETYGPAYITLSVGDPIPDGTQHYVMAAAITAAM